jgi:NADPH:quinone reductase-like Zn-dependent oxidoreductase
MTRLLTQRISMSRAGSVVIHSRMLGWGAVGVVREVGSSGRYSKPKTKCFPGSIPRPGSYSEFHVVDDRIIGHKYRTIDAASG